MLEGRGLVADVAATGVEAIEAWARVPYDLVLMDCRMPEMDGYEATREIRRREDGRRTPIVAMTAAALPLDRQRSLDAGMDDHVVKPVRGRELESVLTRFLDPAPAAAPAVSPADGIGETAAAMGDAFARVADAFLADATASIRMLHGAAASDDGRAVAALAHRLKGSAGIVGARTLADLCQGLVDDPADPAPRIDALDRELALVRARLLAPMGQAE
jgi:CheY-like chemotaxis protein